MTLRTPGDKPSLSVNDVDRAAQLARAGEQMTHTEEASTNRCSQQLERLTQAFRTLRDGARQAPANETLVERREAILATVRRENDARQPRDRTGYSVSQRMTVTLNARKAIRPWFWPVFSLVAAIVGAFLFARPRHSHVMGMTQTYATGAGQRATLALDDGTRVILAPQTTLRLVHFDASSRTVMLDGEAYFEVLHATGTPFMVRAGSATARVLGTAFMVRHYRNDARARIAVTSGKVAISAASPHVAAAILTTGHVGDVTDSTVNVNTNGDAMSEAGWVRGKLIFHDVPLTQVLATLSRWYGYQFRFTDPALQQQNVTVGFNTQSSAAALALLEQVLGVKATVVGDTVTLAPRSARPSQSNTRIRTYDVWIPTKEVGR